MGYPAHVWQLYQGPDGHGRPYRIVVEMTLVGPCPNIEGCHVNADGQHVQRVYLSREDVPEPTDCSKEERE